MSLLPPPDERRLLGRFYLAGFLGECLHAVAPFQFVYLAFVFHDDPALAAMVVLVGAVAVLAFEVPTGALADRFGRKRSVIAGDVVQGAALCLVPVAAVAAPEPLRFPLLCLLAVVQSFGETLVSGAEDAWICDNLEARGRPELAETYFARERSLASTAGLVAGAVALTATLLALDDPAAPVLHALWIASGLAQAAGALVLAGVPELEPAESADPREEEDEPEGALDTAASALRHVGRSPLLARLILHGALVIVAVGALEEALDLSLAGRHAAIWVFPVLWLARDVLGMILPSFSSAVGRALGIRTVLVLTVILPAAGAAALLASPGIAVVCGVALLFAAANHLAGPLLDARIMQLARPSVRATVGSLANQLEHVGEIASLGILLTVLGAGDGDLARSLPSLAGAFAEGIDAVGDAGAADLAVVILGAVGLVGLLPLLGARAALIDGAGRSVPGENVAPPRELLEARDRVQAVLEELNPGEELSWWVAARPFVVPADTLADLERAGPALDRFFPAARAVAERHDWVRRHVEKDFHPVYRALNDAQRDRFPVLLRPDVVPDRDWTPRIVELEFTVAGRADVGAMALAHRLDRSHDTAGELAAWLAQSGHGGQTVGLLTAPHPFFRDLPDDAAGFATLLRRHGVDAVVLGGGDLEGLRFDGVRLLLHGAEGPPRQIHVVDRFVDIYEIAELQHDGMVAVRDAYLAGAVRDLGTCAQFLDEKVWMALLHDPRLTDDWRRDLGEEHFATLTRLVPVTRLLRADTTVPVEGDPVPVRELHHVPAALRAFVIKESGTSTTSSGAQGVRHLAELSDDAVRELVDRVLAGGVLHVVQELVESARVTFDALDIDDPASPRPVRQRDARVKLSPYYVGGRLCDIRFVASNVRYAVNDEDFVCGVVRRARGG